MQVDDSVGEEVEHALAQQPHVSRHHHDSAAVVAQDVPDAGVVLAGGRESSAVDMHSGDSMVSGPLEPARALVVGDHDGNARVERATLRGVDDGLQVGA